MVYMCFACSMDSLFSLSVHHGDILLITLENVGGKVDVVENCDPDR